MAFEHTEHFAPEEEMIRLAEYAESKRVQREQAAALEAAPRRESA